MALLDLIWISCLATGDTKPSPVAMPTAASK